MADFTLSADLSTLLARAEAAEGPDRELDARIFCAVNGYTFRSHRPDLGTPPTGSAYVAYYEPKNGEHPNAYCPAFTATHDAALALCERELPGWLRDAGERYIGIQARDWIAHVETPWQDSPTTVRWTYCGRAKTPALALLAALLKAKIAQASGKEGARRG